MSLTVGHSTSAVAGEDRLMFDAARFARKTLTLDERIFSYRAYEGIAYVSNPVDTKYQSMNKSFVIASAQKALQSGKDLSRLSWITIEGRAVKDLDFHQYVNFATRMKTAPALASLDLTTPENNLFGTASVDSRHFTHFSKENSTDHSLADTAVIKMLNPMNYIGSKGATTAPHWRIRHGVIDRDTSLAIPVILATKLQNSGFEVDFAAP